MANPRRFGQLVTVKRQIVRVLADRHQVFEDEPDPDPSPVFTRMRSAGYAPEFRAVLGRSKIARYDHPSHTQAHQGWTEWPGIGITEEEAPQPTHRWAAPDLRTPYDVSPAVELEPARSVTHWVRFRRVDLASPLIGIVVGTVTLQEGSTHDYGMATPYSDGDAPYFSQQRRVPFVEVAIETDGKARLMLCWRDDVKNRKP